MSFLKKLLNNAQIKWKKVGEVCEVGDGNHSSKYPRSDEMVNHGVSFIRGTNIVNGTISNEDMKYITAEKHQELRKGHLKAYDVLIANRGEIGKIAYVPKHFAGSNLNSQLAWLRANPTIILPRYLFFVLNTSFIQSSISGEGGALQQLTIKNIKLIQIPVPALEVQEEIVRILDTFTAITAELSAELSIRKKQYNYYCHQLLSFSENEVEWEPLGELAANLDSKRKPITSGLRDAGEIPYYGASGIVDYVKDYIFDGDFLLVSEDGANLLARNTPIAFSISGKTWVNNHAHVLNFDTYAERRFVEYYLNSIDLTPYISGAAQPKLNKKNLESIPIPNPSLEEKEKIVAILDKFDALTNSLTEGLPREIELRQKQYDYYRDLLFSFPQSNVVEA